MVTAQSAPHIERVPCLLIGLLAGAGKIPELAPDILALSKRPAARRLPNAKEMGAYTWVVAWVGERDDDGFQQVSGVLGFRDCFDFHTATDVREIVYVNGPATIRLLRWAKADACGRRTVGALDLSNVKMRRLAKALGYTATRMMYEAL